MYICITFDYELFFGKNIGTYDEVLFQPTYALIDELEKRGISATFFADVCSIPVAEKYNQIEYINGFQKQLIYMKQHGHDVQLHLHPHWYHSIWTDEGWNFSNQGYRIHEYEEGCINDIISRGIGFLKETLFPIDNNYECIAYRAGGFSIQPHEQVITSLYDNGIRVDSSVAPQLYINSEANFYDYRHKLEKVNWNISNSTDWWRDSKEGKYLFEIPVATIDKSPIPFLLRRAFVPKTVKLDLGKKRGTYISAQTTTESRWKAYYKYTTGFNTISMDSYSAEYLYTQTKRFLAKTKAKDSFVAIIGHPKLVNQKYIANLCRYIDMINKDNRFEFVSVYDAYRLKKNCVSCLGARQESYEE